MRTETIVRTLYQFDELTEKAKETARDWYREGIFSDGYAFDSVIDDAKEIGRLMGIDISNVYYSVSSSQGDGACFEGSYRYVKGSVKQTLSYAPVDSEIERIVKGLQQVQKRNGYKLTAKVKSGRYPNSSWAEIDISKNTINGENYPTIETDIEVKELLKDFMNWIYKRLVQEEEYLSSAESIDDNILCNEYEFLESGKRS